MFRMTLKRKEALAFYIFIAPCLLGLLFFTVGPIIVSLFMSFTDWDILTTPQWIGAQNYIDIFTDDDLFWKSLGNTLFYMIFAVPIGITAGFSLAMLLNQKVKGMTFYRTIFYLPSIVPAVANSMLWMWIFHPDYGLLNSALKMGGINGPQWLYSTTWAKPALIIMGLWGAGSGMIIYLAGLQGIPDYLYEAADIDGANKWQKFRHVTIPMMSPVLFFNLIMGIIGTFQVFTEAFVMTSGGPANATLFYSYYLYQKAFQQFQMGYASALAWILFVIILIMTIIQFRFVGRRVHYD